MPHLDAIFKDTVICDLFAFNSTYIFDPIYAHFFQVCFELLSMSCDLFEYITNNIILIQVHFCLFQAERQAVNSTIQGSAADLVKKAMVNIEKEFIQVFPQSSLPHRIHGQEIHNKGW